MKAKQIQWNATKAEIGLIMQIAKRAVALAKTINPDTDYDVLESSMDLEACHCNGMPLDFEKLLRADDFNLAHDVFGIRQHINRHTGEIEDCFVPRCSAQP